MLKRIGAVLALALTATFGVTASAEAAVSCNSWPWHSTRNNNNFSACIGIKRVSTSAIEVTTAVQDYSGLGSAVQTSGGSTWVTRAYSAGGTQVYSFNVYCANGDGSHVYGRGVWVNIVQETFATYTC